MKYFSITKISKLCEEAELSIRTRIVPRHHAHGMLMKFILLSLVITLTSAASLRNDPPADRTTNPPESFSPHPDYTYHDPDLTLLEIFGDEGDLENDALQSKIDALGDHLAHAATHFIKGLAQQHGKTAQLHEISRQHHATKNNLFHQSFLETETTAHAQVSSSMMSQILNNLKLETATATSTTAGTSTLGDKCNAKDFKADKGKSAAAAAANTVSTPDQPTPAGTVGNNLQVDPETAAKRQLKYIKAMELSQQTTLLLNTLEERRDRWLHVFSAPGKGHKALANLLTDVDFIDWKKSDYMELEALIKKSTAKDSETCLNRLSEILATQKKKAMMQISENYRLQPKPEAAAPSALVGDRGKSVGQQIKDMLKEKWATIKMTAEKDVGELLQFLKIAVSWNM